MKNPRYIDMQERRKLTPCTTITLGLFDRTQLTQSVWQDAMPMARALLIHKDFVVTTQIQDVQLVALGWDIFKKSVPLGDVGQGKLFDHDYLFEWSRQHLNSQQLVPCKTEDVVQLWQQRFRLLPIEKEDVFKAHSTWSSMPPLPHPFGMRFYVNQSRSHNMRKLDANQYGVGTVSMSNIFHSQGGLILYRLVDVH